MCSCVLGMSWCFLMWLGYKLHRTCCDRKTPAGVKTAKIENSLKNSKTKDLKRLLLEDNVNIEEAVDSIMRIKSIREEVHSRFRPTMRRCLCQICGYRQLHQEVEVLKRTPYNSDNAEHEKKLLQLWQHLRPGTRLNGRISKQWSEIGFQGDDPMTDFRGMGLLGLENLLFFVTRYGDAARKMLSHSNHPTLGYSFAIVGINLTHVVYELLVRGHLKPHFYNSVEGRPLIEHFHYVYCYIFMEFDKFWFNAKPPSIMEFNIYKAKFQKRLVRELKNKKTCFKIQDFVEYNQQVASAPL